jgi:serine/threonine protein kinase
MRKMVTNFIHSNFLVEGEKKDDSSEAIQPSFKENDKWLSYRILENIHVIVDSEIYKVKHIPSGELRALKISQNSFPNEKMKDKIFERLKKEFEIIEKINHPSTVKVWEYGESQGRMYGVLDWIDGSSVRAYAYSSDTPPSRDLLLRLAIECLESLHAVHRAGYLHGDVHTGNFLVRDHHVCLIDFGLSRPIEVKKKDRSKYTEGGVTEYMPPEYARHRNDKKKLWGSVAGEIYSSAVIIFTLFTRKYPYPTSFYRKDFLKSILNDPPPSFEECEVEPWPELEAVLHRAMAKDPTERFQTADEFAGELKKIKDKNLLGDSVE